jgi:hypothetical protein
MIGRLCSASALALLMIAGLAKPARAQGYVAASVLGDIARFNEYDSGGDDTSGSGEAIGFALRLGTAIGTRWGVELEFARPSEIESEFSPPYILTAVNVAAGPVPPSVGSPVVPDVYFPYSFRTEARRRNTTLSTSVWIGQPVTKRFALKYLAGIAFGRTSQDIDIVYEPIPRLAPVITVPTRASTSATTYDVGPLVGVEGEIGLTEHVQLIPGFRLHGVEGGWLLRPSVGLGWNF